MLIRDRDADVLRRLLCGRQVKVRRKVKTTEKESSPLSSPVSPTVPRITYDVFDSGKELSSDVYSTVGTGTQ